MEWSGLSGRGVRWVPRVGGDISSPTQPKPQPTDVSRRPKTGKTDQGEIVLES